ncbi:MAG TPA: cellulase family glycosylhydrolase [Polyangiaceae bacterium]|nr:cellulase family glycosylhydrolase [Polyangiaceae bacterium]
MNVRRSSPLCLAHLPVAVFIAIAATTGCAEDSIVPGGSQPMDGGSRDASSADGGASDVVTGFDVGRDIPTLDAAGTDVFDAPGVDVDAADVSLDMPTDSDVSMDAPARDGSAVPDAGGALDVQQDPMDPPLDPPKLTTHRLTTRGDVLIDELGRAVILRGVNVGGRSKMPPFLPFEFADAGEIPAQADKLMSSVRALGSNAVRLTFSWEALEGVRGTFDAEYLRRYGLLLDAAQKADLHVIVDVHQDVFHAAFCGDGFPEWALGDIVHGAPHYDCVFPFWSLPYFDAASTVSQAFDRFWTNKDGLFDAFEAMWRHVAREIGRHPAVAAFEIINEPGAGSTALDVMGHTILPPLYDRIAAAIEVEAGAAAIVCDEPVSSTADIQYLARPSHARFVYGPHYYDGATTLGIGPLDANRIRTAVTALLARTGGWNAPTIVGEFGAPNSVTFKGDYLAAIFDALDTGRASGLLWDVALSNQKWNSEDFGPLLADGTETAWAGILDRPAPRAIDGTITSFAWDTAAKQFSLAVSSAGDAVSQIYLPVRHLGMSPDIAVTGARFRWLPASGQLLVAAPRGASWTVLVKAR